MLDKKTTYVEDAKEGMISYHRGLTVTDALVAAIAEQMQELENAIYDLNFVLSITYSEGPQLDRIGRIVDQNREGNDDKQYRMYLLVKVLINIGSGTAEEIITIYHILTGEKKSRMQWDEMWALDAADYATCRLTFLDPLDTNLVDTDRMQKIALLCKPCGVKFGLRYQPLNPFTWDTVGAGWDIGLWGGGI